MFIATNRRLGNIDMTVTKDWSSSTSLLDALKNSDIVPVVKLVVDTDKTSAVPPGEDQKIEDIINYDTNKITLTNDQVPILNNEGKQATAIQRLLDENGEPVETGMFGVGHDSQQVFVEPRVDRTHHRVVVRVHLVAGGVLP